MKNKRKILLIFVYSLFIFESSAQIETTIFDLNTVNDINTVPFFTNRILQVNEDNSFTFKNSSTDQTNTLYFCNYNYETDSIGIRLRAVNYSDEYPTENLKNNFIYDIYENYRLKKGIKVFYVVVGGYGKSFDKQVHDYMKRLKSSYGDSLFNKAVVSVFAWGTQDKSYRYYNALKVARRSAADFAIWQHMLDEFMSDSVYWETHPKDFKIGIMFSSMANELFRSYILERQRQNIPLVKTYSGITFVGSVAPRDVFEEGKAFHNLNQMADTVRVIVNKKDVLLKMSSVAHLKNRLGNLGPKRPGKLPDFVVVSDISNLMTIEDMKRMGHDYVLTNPIFKDAMLESFKDDSQQNE